MHVDVFGPSGARPVLLLHGGGVGGWMWEPVRAHLGNAVRLIVPDLPGHDRSAHIPYRSHRDTVDRLIAVIEGVGPVTIVGFSLGAQIAVLLAAERPDLVDAVIVISAQAEPLPAPGPTLALLSLAAPLARREWFARLQAKELFIPESLMGDYLRTSALISRDTLRASVSENIRFVVPDGWREFSGSVLLLVGETERALMHRSARALRGDREPGVRETVAGCGHGIPLQRPEWLADRITAMPTR